MNDNSQKFNVVELGEHTLSVGRLPDWLMPGEALFDALWKERPEENQFIRMGGLVAIPRRQQAYGKDYHFSGQVSKARPITKILEPFLRWSQNSIDPALNGLLLNWYEDGMEYIGPHRDDNHDLVPKKPIVTISLGAERIFRLRPWRVAGPHIDLRALHGTVIEIPGEAYLAYTHEVRKTKRRVGKRISITLRAFV